MWISDATSIPQLQCYPSTNVLYYTLSCNLLAMQSQGLEFQVWSKANEPQKDSYIGSAHIDLCPLSFGLSHICGWYNITDFGGQSQGQLKVREFTEYVNHKDLFFFSSYRSAFLPHNASAIPPHFWLIRLLPL